MSGQLFILQPSREFCRVNLLTVKQVGHYVLILEKNKVRKGFGITPHFSNLLWDLSYCL